MNCLLYFKQVNKFHLDIIITKTLKKRTMKVQKQNSVKYFLGVHKTLQKWQENNLIGCKLEQRWVKQKCSIFHISTEQKK